MIDRYKALRDIARNEGVDAVALVPGANFSRLFNAEFHQSERPLVVIIPTDGKPSAIVPNLELASFADMDFEGEVYDWRDQDGFQAAFDALMQNNTLKTLGVEGQVMRVFIDQAFRKSAPDLAIQDLQKSIASLRLSKNPEELNALRTAISISEKALANTLDQVKVGMTERAIESILIQQLFSAGAQSLSFPPIVAASTNSAQPHAHSRENYQIQAGDAVLIDFGARAQGMCADITRTFFVSHCDDRHRDVYNTVLSANLAGHKASRPGATAHDVDDATTAVLEASAFASRISHKTGHGLGRDVHEDPYIMRGNHEKLVNGMVYTIEPGLYDLTEFGVRIEDDVLITENGCDSLTTFDKTLTIIG